LTLADEHHVAPRPQAGGPDATSKSLGSESFLSDALGEVAENHAPSVGVEVPPLRTEGVL
jgi:hypothetical protein